MRRADAAGASPTARKALGFEELLRGDPDAMKRRTRNYAKRQLTWMRRLEGANLLDAAADPGNRVVRLTQEEDSVKRIVVAAMTAACCLAMAGPAAAARLDFGKQTYSILPPGQSGSIPFVRHSIDQLPLYDALTPLFDDVGPAHIKRLFRSARFFAPKGGRVEHPKRGLTIRTDRQWGVPHIQGRTRFDVFFGIGWATARDRGIFMETLRYPARFSILDAPGYDTLSVATSLRGFNAEPPDGAFHRGAAGACWRAQGRAGGGPSPMRRRTWRA